MLPGVSISTISEFLQRVHGRIGSTQFRGRSVPGWYLQQFVKIGVALKVPDLSKHYLIWDSDMLMTKEYKMFTEDGRVRQHSGGFFIRQYASFYRLTGETLPFSTLYNTARPHTTPHHTTPHAEYSPALPMGWVRGAKPPHDRARALPMGGVLTVAGVRSLWRQERRRREAKSQQCRRKQHTHGSGDEEEGGDSNGTFERTNQSSHCRTSVSRYPATAEHAAGERKPTPPIGGRALHSSTRHVDGGKKRCTAGAGSGTPSAYYNTAREHWGVGLLLCTTTLPERSRAMGSGTPSARCHTTGEHATLLGSSG